MKHLVVGTITGSTERESRVTNNIVCFLINMIFKISGIIMAVNRTGRQPGRVVIHFPEYFFTVEVNASCFLWKS